MKKSSKIILSVLVVAVVLFGTYRIVNKAFNQFDSNAQMAEIIESSGCMACHTANPQLRFMRTSLLPVNW